MISNYRVAMVTDADPTALYINYELSACLKSVHSTEPLKAWNHRDAPPSPLTFNCFYTLWQCLFPCSWKCCWWLFHWTAVIPRLCPDWTWNTGKHKPLGVNVRGQSSWGQGPHRSRVLSLIFISSLFPLFSLSGVPQWWCMLCLSNPHTSLTQNMTDSNPIVFHRHFRLPLFLFVSSHFWQTLVFVEITHLFRRRSPLHPLCVLVPSFCSSPSTPPCSDLLTLLTLLCGQR